MKRSNTFKLVSLIVSLIMFVAAVPMDYVGANDAELISENFGLDSYIDRKVVKILETTYENYNGPVFALYDTPNGDCWTYTVNVSGTDKNGVIYKKANIAEVYDFYVIETQTDSEGVLWFCLGGSLWDLAEDIGRWIPADKVELDGADVSVDDTMIGLSGNIPGDIDLNTSALDEDELNTAFDSIIDISHLKSHSVSIKGFDINPVIGGSDWQPEDTVSVRISGIWDSSVDYPMVDVYHILDTELAIRSAKEAGTLLTSSDADLCKAYVDEVTLAQKVLGEDVVAYTLLSSRNDTVILNKDGSISFETDSFSNYIISSGSSTTISISGASYGPGNQGSSTTNTEHNVYMVVGTTANITVSDSDVTVTESDNNAETISVSQSSQSSGNNQRTSYTLTADSAAKVDDKATFTFTWTGGQNQSTTYSSTVNVIIIDKEDVEKYQYITNSVDHIQIDIEASAVILGYNNDSEVDIDLSFTSNTSYTLTKVSDADSSVGYYYQLTYMDSNNVTTTITIKVDETQEYPVMPDFEIDAISIKDGQISFDGNFPVGTKDKSVRYIITVETTLSLIPNDKTDAEAVNVALSDTIGYWDDENECPGLGQGENWANGELISNSGIDLSKFNTGATLGDQIVYVVFSNLTKKVEGYTFSDEETASRAFVFTISRRLKNTTDAWEAIDTVTITANTPTTTTTITTDASKYDFNTYEYKIDETAYSINGYSCSTTMSGGIDSNNVIKWSTTESADKKTITYSTEIICTNTYEKVVSGLTVNKIVKKQSDADSLPTGDMFEIAITPINLEIEDSESEFNNNEYSYTKTAADGTKSTGTVTPTGENITGFKTLNVDIKAGESINFDLPVGRYTVKETEGENTNYIYDETVYTVEIIEGNAETVTFENTYKQQKTSLTIKKTGADEIDENQTFIFDIKGVAGMELTVSVLGNGEITIVNLPIGEYTVTEITDWSWRYTPDVTIKSIELGADATKNVVTFTNTREVEKWLDSNTSANNVFSDTVAES